MKKETDSLRHGAGVCLRPEVRTLHLVGPDRVRFLNGMVTNDVSWLSPGDGQVAIKTNNKGRVEGVLRVRAEADRLVLDLLEAVSDQVKNTLEQFIIMDDCAVEDVSATRDVVTILGPKAGAMVQNGLGLLAPEDAHAFVQREGTTVIADRSLGVHGYEIHAVSGQGEALLQKLVGAGAEPVTATALNIVRVESGVPVDGPDIDLDTIPMEARLDYAISSKKGCYVGQEVIARATNLGQVAYLLVGLDLEGDPGQETVLKDIEGAPCGELCSVVDSPAFGKKIGLAYVKRRYSVPETTLKVAETSGTVRDLPFVAI